MTTDIVLYSYHKSSASWRIRILLNLKKITYEYKAVRLASEFGDQQKEDFKALNPSGQVPVLLIDGLHLSESVAIAEYIEETRPEPALYPKDPTTRARVRTIVEMINAGIQPKQNLSTLTLLAKEYADESAKKRWAAEWNVRGLRGLEEVLCKWAGKCCVGDEITFADCCLVPQVYAAFRFNVDVQQFPTVWRIFSYLDRLPQVQAAHADCQPDADKK